jgi:hypothetical protein
MESPKTNKFESALTLGTKTGTGEYGAGTVTATVVAVNLEVEPLLFVAVTEPNTNFALCAGNN